MIDNKGVTPADPRSAAATEIRRMADQVLRKVP
jgi:hypothetical protein